MYELNNNFPASEVKEIFNYENGNLIWIKKTGRKVVLGTVAGRPRSDGYCVVGVKKKVHRVHRIVWAWHHGVWPPFDIDHIDQNQSNNKIENLREATRSENNCNTGVRSDNTSGAKGIYFDKKLNKYRAQIMFEKKKYHIGLFVVLEDAIKARAEYAEYLHKQFARA